MNKKKRENKNESKNVCFLFLVSFIAYNFQTDHVTIYNFKTDHVNNYKT